MTASEVEAYVRRHAAFEPDTPPYFELCDLPPDPLDGYVLIEPAWAIPESTPEKPPVRRRRDPAKKSVRSETVPSRSRLIPAKEVAAMRGCTPKHIYQLCLAHKIPHSKFDNAVMFNRDDIEKWLDSHKIA